MLTNSHTSPPEQPPSTRRQQLKYLDRFNRWARKLDDADLGMLVDFCATVHQSWIDGRAKQPESAAEQVAEGSAPIQHSLPGLGGANAPD